MRLRNLGPLDPIFDSGKNSGSIAVGATPPSVPPPCTGIFTILGSVQDTYTNAIASTTQYSSDRLFASATYIEPATAAGYRVITSIDISDPTSPAVVDWFSGFSMQTCGGIVVDGDYAYVGTGSLMVVVDVSTPKYVPVAGLVVGSTNNGMFKVGDYVYVGSQAQARLSVVDVSDPLSPVVVGSLTDATNLNNIWGIAVSGNYAFVTAGGSSRFQVIDVSNPASMSIVATLSTNWGNASGMAMDGSYVYALGNFGLNVVDVSTPTSPVAIGRAVTSPFAAGSDLVKDGNYAYSVHGQVLYVWDVSTPTAPTQITTFNPDAATLVDITKSGNYLYIGVPSLDRVRVIDVSTPSSPSSAGSITDSVLLDQVRPVFVVGSTLYTAGDEVFTSLDISTPTSPSIDWTTYGYLLTTATPTEIYGDYIVTVSQTSPIGALTILDASDPDNLSVVGFVRHTNLVNAQRMRIQGDYAYVGSANADRITVVDISSPTAPSVMGSITHILLDNVTIFDVQGDYVYAPGFTADALVVIDVSVPSTPTIVASVASSATLDQAIAVAVSGDYAYVACLNGRLTVVDISTPTVPVVLGTVTSSVLNGAVFVLVDGETCFITAQTTDSIVAVNVSDPTTPTVVASITDGTLLDVVRYLNKDGDYLYATSLNASRMTVVEYVCLD